MSHVKKENLVPMAVARRLVLHVVGDRRSELGAEIFRLMTTEGVRFDDAHRRASQKFGTSFGTGRAQGRDREGRDDD